MFLHRNPLGCAPLLFVAVSFTACGGSANSLGEQPTLTGQITDWNLGGGYVVKLSVAQRNSSNRTSLPPDAPIDAAGNFSLTLPGEAVLKQVGTPQPIKAYSGCSGILVAEPKEALLIYASMTDTGMHQYASHQLHQEVAGTVAYSSGVSAAYAYADRDLSITGTEQCQFLNGRPYTTTYKVQYRKGWNLDVHTFGTGSEEISSTAPPEGLNWVRAYAPFP